MVLFIVLVLVLIWSAIIAWVYGIINPFVDELWNIQRYNQAYYWAIAWVERAELVLRGHTAWFEWSWWWLWNNNFWNQSDYKITDFEHFWFLSLKQFWNWITWSIKSMTDWVVPKPWKWNLDPDISSGNDYVKLDFNKALQYALYRDKSLTGDYYTWVKDENIENIQINGWISVSIRTPFKLTCAYNSSNWNCNSSSRDSLVLLDNDNNDLDWDWIKNDVIVNRTLFGYTWDTQFTIFPTVDVDTEDNLVNSGDTTIREDVINWYVNSDGGFNIKYDTTSKDTNPNEVWDHTSDVAEFNQSPDDAVSTWFDFVLNENYEGNFDYSKKNSKIWKMNLKFSLVNVPEYDESKIYPYLEVKLKAEDAAGDGTIPIPDLNFHITGEGKVIDYDVKILISKPVFDTTAASDFTILF